MKVMHKWERGLESGWRACSSFHAETLEPTISRGGHIAGVIAPKNCLKQVAKLFVSAKMNCPEVSQHKCLASSCGSNRLTLCKSFINSDIKDITNSET
eukprot:1138926-Pelagomonas_calceolata.AAC.2